MAEGSTIHKYIIHVKIGPYSRRVARDSGQRSVGPIALYPVGAHPALRRRSQLHLASQTSQVTKALFFAIFPFLVDLSRRLFGCRHLRQV